MAERSPIAALLMVEDLLSCRTILRPTKSYSSEIFNECFKIEGHVESKHGGNRKLNFQLDLDLKQMNTQKPYSADLLVFSP